MSEGASAWWRSSVVYQIWPRSYADGDGDGIGDLTGIASRLDHVADLGVDVIWLSPIYPSPGDDAGYDVSDHCDVDPLFGTLEQFDRLLSSVHARGMKLIMDLVVNHTSDRHRWFEASRRALDDPQRDWYWWRPARDGLSAGAPGAEPNNWRSNFGGSAWRFDPATGEYYLHLFGPTQPDLNWENPEVRAAVHDVMRWWLDRGVDGFRMDVINMISKDVALPDGPGIEGSPYGDGWAHFVEGPRLHEFLREMHQAVFTGRTGLLTVGEMPGVTVDQARAHTDPKRAELDMVFEFEHVAIDHGPSGRFDLQPLDLTALKATMGRWQAGLAEVGWNSLYWCNHDQPRVVSRFGDDDEHRARSAKLLATVLHMHRGTPYIYQGEEIGMANYPFTSPDELRDIESLRELARRVAAGDDPQRALAAIRPGVRDNARTPMQWDASTHAGFTSGAPWMPLNPDHHTVNVAAQATDPESVLAHYRRLIALRHELPVIVDGTFTMVAAAHPHVYAFTRHDSASELLILSNWSSTRVGLDVPDGDRWRNAELLISNTTTPPGPGARVELAPWEAVVYKRPTTATRSGPDRRARVAGARASRR